MFTKMSITLTIGAFLFFLLFNYFDPTWTREASIDIFLDAIIETFTLNLLLHFYNERQDKKNIQHLDKHLKKIELLIIKASANEKE
jgi:predicted membrane channel-forming protein YqfA (hemolysin III family)